MTEWEQLYLEEHTPWEKGEPSPGLVDFLKTRQLHGRVIAPGCGLGHDVREIAKVDPNADVVGLDIAPTAVELANEYPKSGSERFVLGDWFDLPGEFVGAFDWVWEHTCFCAIDPSMRGDYVQAAKRALKPDGQLLGNFYLDPYDEEHPVGTDHPPYGATLEEIEGHFSPDFEILESWIPDRAYEGREGRERMMLMRLKR